MRCRVDRCWAGRYAATTPSCATLHPRGRVGAAHDGRAGAGLLLPACGLAGGAVEWCPKGEIRRLAVDCLDAYPDGTPRLRVPVGKTRRERMVPLHDEAAAALREVTASGQDGRTRLHRRAQWHPPPTTCSWNTASCSPITTCLRRRCARPVRRPAWWIPTAALPLRPIGFATRWGPSSPSAERNSIPSCRFSGHTSVSMALVYAQISDPEVLRDYQTSSVLAPPLAGPAAEGPAQWRLPSATLEWLKTNFFKNRVGVRALLAPAGGRAL